MAQGRHTPDSDRVSTIAFAHRLIYAGEERSSGDFIFESDFLGCRGPIVILLSCSDNN